MKQTTCNPCKYRVTGQIMFAQKLLNKQENEIKPENPYQ